MHIFSSQPPPAQSMVQALELLYALGGEILMVYFICSCVIGVVKKITICIWWLESNKICIWELCSEKGGETQLWLVETFCWGFLECTSISSSFTFFSFGYFRHVNKQTAAIEFKLEFNYLDWVNECFITILSVFPCNFTGGNQLFVLARTGL